MEEIFKTELDVRRENQKAGWVELRRRYMAKTPEERRARRKAWLSKIGAEKRKQYKQAELLRLKIKRRVKLGDAFQCKFCYKKLDLLSKSPYFCSEEHRILYRKEYQKYWSHEKHLRKKEEQERKKNEELSEIPNV